MKDNGVLVKIVTYKEDKEITISTYWTEHFDETLKMYITAKDNELGCYFNEFSEVVNEKYSKRNVEFMIEDIQIQFGSSQDLTVIRVVVV
jgi:hypothetical protein